MTVIFAGPYGTMFLADMGAETIRVETLNHLPATSRGPFARPNKESQLTAISSPYPDRDPGDRPWNRASNFNAHSRNKSGMTLELGQPEAKDIFRRLVEVSDLFIENNAAGSMARLGVSWDVVSKWNPRLIMISVCGFGQTGPWSEYRGIGTQFEAAVGHASVSGYPDMGIDGAPGSVATDASSGVTVAIAAMLALHQREKTGKGMYIDISLGENFLPHLGELYMDYTINGRVAGPPGNRDWWHVQGAYPCAGDDEWIALTIGRIEQWRALCQLMGKPDLLEDDRFVDMNALRAHHDEVDDIVAAWTSGYDPIALFHRLQSEGIPAGIPDARGPRFRGSATEGAWLLRPHHRAGGGHIPLPQHHFQDVQRALRGEEAAGPPGRGQRLRVPGGAGPDGGGVRPPQGPRAHRHGLRAAREVGGRFALRNLEC